MLSENDLRQIMPKIPADKFQLYFLMLNRVMSDFQIDPPLRAAAFLAQLAHESGELRFMAEIWGPTAAQLRYEPPSDLAARLGNTQPGDGKLFRGRGPIQITGRANYKRYGDMLGVDLIRNPDLASTTQIAFQIAGLYWVANGLNALADAQDFIGITKRINGGTNGLADRQKYYAIAKNVLGVGTVAGVRSVAMRAGFAEAAAVPEVSARVSEDDNAPLPPPKLPRGYEAILEDSEHSAPAPPPPSNGESKKKSARSSSRTSKKSVSKKSVKKGATQVPTISTKKTSKKTATKPAAKSVKTATKKAAKKAPVKAAKPAPKKAVKKAAPKAAKKTTVKSAGKAAKKAAGKKPAIRIIIVKSAKKAAKKSK